MNGTPTFRDPETAFDEAIAAGRLSSTPGTDNYAGRYMYMGTWADVDAFKHIDTREYLSATDYGTLAKSTPEMSESELDPNPYNLIEVPLSSETVETDSHER